MIDELELVRSTRPATSPPDDAVVDRMRSDLLRAAGVRSVTSAPSGRRHRLRRPLQVTAAVTVAVAVAGTAAASTIWSGHRVERTDAVECTFPGEGDAILPSATGDPVADCGHLWEREHHQPAPALAAYDTGTGGVQVLFATATPPRSDRPLPTTFRQDQAVMQLDHVLDDAVTGLGPGATCRSTTDGVALAASELDRLGLRGWKVTTDGTADGTHHCAFYALDGHARSVLILGHFEPEPVGQLADLVALDRQLAAQMIDGPSARCLDGARAAAAVSTAVAQAGVSGQVDVQPGYGTADAPDGRTTCARPSLDVGGSAVVHLDVVTAAQFRYAATR